MLKNSSSFRKSTTFDLSNVQNSLASMSRVTGTSRRIVVRNSARSAISRFSVRLFLALGGVTSSRFSYIPSRLPNSASSLIAVFLPMPGTPGILSEVSPSRALISAIDSGPRPPYRSRTAPSS